MPDNKKKATSLMKQSQSKKNAAAAQEKIGKSQVAKGMKKGSMGTDLRFGGTGKPIPVGNERLAIAKRLRSEATRDSLKAVKLYPGIVKKKK